MPVEQLASPPRLGALYARAAGGAGLAALRGILGSGRLPLIGERPRELPHVELTMGDVTVSRDHLAAYSRVCTFEMGDELPPTYPHILAFPLAMRLMTASDFPFPVIGLIHVSNRIEQLRPILAEERLSLRVRAADLAPHDRGTQFRVIAEADAGGELAWRSASTYLRREQDSGSSKDGSKRDAARPAPSMGFTVAADIGRRYAAVSGDRNPIHLHPVTARLFGMPRPIAHGMWLKARCLAVLGGPSSFPWQAEVDFKLPVFLPSRVALGSVRSADAVRFSLTDDRSGKPHLTGALGQAAPPTGRPDQPEAGRPRERGRG